MVRKGWSLRPIWKVQADGHWKNLNPLNEILSKRQAYTVRVQPIFSYDQLFLTFTR